MRFDVVQGNIARQTAHGLVSTTGSESRMKCGVAGVLRTHANGPIVDDMKQAQPVDCGDVVVTNAYELPAIYLFHAVPMSQDGSATEHGIRTATRSTLERADELKCRSLVFPLIGCGGGGYVLEAGATCICEAIWAFEPDSLADIRIIAHTEDDFELLLDAARMVETQPASF